MLPDDCYDIDGDAVTIDGAKAANALAASDDPYVRNHGGINVRADVMYGEENLSDANCWVSFRNPCEGEQHDWSEKVLEAPGCKTTGSKRLNCADCGEQRIVDIPATGHSIVAVAAKAATLTATGTKAHFKCTVCGKLFSDQAGTKQVTAASLTIPKLVNLSGATISGLKNKTYTGKALTQTPVVKVGSKTLKAGTDYTVSYKNNKNAGKATVTVTGKGNYGGSKSATFTIAKAANPMKVKAVKKSVKAADVKKKAKKVKGAVKVSKQQGKVTYAFAKATKKAAKTKKFKINSKGEITVPKGTAKGTYSLKVTVTAAGNANYKKLAKTVTVKVTVK